MTARTEEQDEDGSGRRLPRMSRLARIVAVVLLVLALVLAFVWFDRKPIANSFIRDELRKRGVPARYHIAHLGLSTQRLTDVVIGDPAHPDLVADWVEVHMGYSFSGPQVTGVSAGHVRLRGKLVDGTLHLGAIDRLLPAPSGKPFTLPTLDVDVGDARMRLETPYGLVGLKLAGEGQLDDGFDGRLSAVAPRLDVAGCTARRVIASMKLSVSDRQPSVTGPLQAASADCGGVGATRIATRIDATLGEALDRWKGNASLDLARLVSPSAKLADLTGKVSFEGGPQNTEGEAELASGTILSAAGVAKSAGISGRYTLGAKATGFDGTVSASHVRASDAMLRPVAGVADAAAGTPVAPLLRKAVRAAIAAGRDASINGALTIERGKDGGSAELRRATVTAASGASLMLTGRDGIRVAWPDGGVTLGGLLTMSGGGLPEATVRLSQKAPRSPVTGTAILAPYAAGDARLSLRPVEFSAAPDGETRITTEATLSGPIGDGRVEKLRLPLAIRWNGATRLIVDTTCVPIGFDRLTVSGLDLDPTRLRLCPVGNALVSLSGSKLSGGARIDGTHITGKIGSSPLVLDTGASQFRLTDQGFVLADTRVLLGSEGNVTQIQADRISGSARGKAIGGSFTGAAGKIANVPLIMSNSDGDWRLVDGKLTLNGGLTLTDAGDPARFKPLESHDFTLTLAGSRIEAGGTLLSPTRGVKVTDVTIVHDLSTNRGHADLDVPGLAFSQGGLQPDDITPLTLGVIANVDGGLNGHGHIVWDANGVTSTGDFHADAANFAAAFGTVKNFSTDLHFTDLLGLVTSPSQTATVGTVEAGIAVENGVAHYALIGDERVHVDGAHWPFAGGTLDLEPTTLDFGASKERRLTFRLEGLKAGQFLQQFDFANFNADGTFDGVIPMIFDESGGRIKDGHLESRSGGSLSYVGEVSQKNLGYWGNVAFQALRSLKYDKLNISLNGPLDGEMVTEIHFGGVKQGKGAKSNFLIDKIMKLPFVFNLTIHAPFRQLINSVESFSDPSQLKEHMPEMVRDAATGGDGAVEKDGDAKDRPAAAKPAEAAQKPKDVQPPESRDMR